MILTGHCFARIVLPACLALFAGTIAAADKFDPAAYKRVAAEGFKSARGLPQPQCDPAVDASQIKVRLVSTGKDRPAAGELPERLQRWTAACQMKPAVARAFYAEYEFRLAGGTVWIPVFVLAMPSPEAFKAGNELDLYVHRFRDDRGEMRDVILVFGRP